MSDNLMDMVPAVAKQMCIVAGADPHLMVFVPESWTLLRVELLSKTVSYFPGASVFAPSPYSSPAEMRMEVKRIPAFRGGDDPEISAPLWTIYRNAAYDALLGHYAVKHVMMAGKEVPK